MRRLRSSRVKTTTSPRVLKKLKNNRVTKEFFNVNIASDITEEVKILAEYILTPRNKTSYNYNELIDVLVDHYKKNNRMNPYSDSINTFKRFFSYVKCHGTKGQHSCLESTCCVEVKHSKEFKTDLQKLKEEEGVFKDREFINLVTLHMIADEMDTLSLIKKKHKTESSVKCWHCGADQKIQSLEKVFTCTSCNGYLWTGEGGYKIEL